MIAKRKRGGQPKKAADRKRNNLTFRTRDKLRNDLEAAAADSQRSISEEIEHRLEDSFHCDQWFSSPELRRIVFLMTDSFVLAGEQWAGEAPKGAWVKDRGVYRHAAVAAVEALLLGMPNASKEDIVILFEAVKGRILSRWANEQEAGK